MRPEEIVKYDILFKEAVAKHSPLYDWRLFKAQLVQESRLDPFAKSPVGALGLAQFMPATWAETSKALGYTFGVLATSVIPSIDCGAYYQAKMVRGWKAPRPTIDRYCLALASYNAGFGNILKAQKKADGANDYKTIIASLHLVTGAANSHETITYIKRILAIYSRLITG